MARVNVVTAYVDLGLTKRPAADFYALGDQLAEARRWYAELRAFRDFPLAHCWAAEEFGRKWPPANARAEDRFVSESEHLRSNLIQHSPVQWLAEAALEDPDPDVFVWLGYSIMKQGAFTGKPIRAEDVQAFLRKVSAYQFHDIPIPSIRPWEPVSPRGDNWQFVGSTLVIPRKHLSAVERSYKAELRNFVMKHRAIPLDLAIWPSVVGNSGLPWRPYPAEYDATQLTNFP